MVLTFIVAFIVICFIGYLIKTSIKMAIAVIIIMTLFGIGYIWGPNDLNEKLGLNKWLNPEYSQKVNNFAMDFEDKRSENSILNQGEMKSTYNKAEEAFEKQSNSFITKSGNIVITIKDKIVEMFNEIKDIITPSVDGEMKPNK